MLKLYTIHIVLRRYVHSHAAIIHWKMASQCDCGKFVNVVACAGSALEKTTASLVTAEVSFSIFYIKCTSHDHECQHT